MEPVTLQGERFVCITFSTINFFLTLKWPSSSPCSDGCTDGTMASSSNDSHYSGSRVETPVSYMGDDDDEDEYDENEDED